MSPLEQAVMEMRQARAEYLALESLPKFEQEDLPFDGEQPLTKAQQAFRTLASKEYAVLCAAEQLY